MTQQPDRAPSYSPTPADRSHSSSVKSAWTIATIGVGVVLIVLIGPFPTCFFKVAFGAPCPGCGLTRATLAMLSLDFAGVYRFHPLAPVVSPVLGWVLLRPLLVRVGIVSPDWLVPRGRLFTALLVGLVIALWVVYAVRLTGGLGGHPDPVTFRDGWVTRWWF
ncbi:MAG: DUF2752 domain-containing protein [Polyangiales bacterium]